MIPTRNQIMSISTNIVNIAYYTKNAVVVFLMLNVILTSAWDDFNISSSPDVDSIVKEVLIAEKQLNANRKEKGMCNQGSRSLLLGVCVCGDSWIGRFCDTPVCRNGGELDGKKCICPAHHEGVHCELTNCGSHGTPIGGADGGRQVCSCHSFYFGPFCQFRCQNGYWTRTNKCKCNEGYGGRDCSVCEYKSPPGECHQRRGISTMTTERATFRSRFALASLSLSVIAVIMTWMSLVARRRKRQLLAIQLAHQHHNSQRIQSQMAASVNRLLSSPNRQFFGGLSAAAASGRRPPHAAVDTTASFGPLSARQNPLYYYSFLGGVLPNPPSFDSAIAESSNGGEAAAGTGAPLFVEAVGPPPSYEDALKQPVVGAPAVRERQQTAAAAAESTIAQRGSSSETDEERHQHHRRLSPERRPNNPTTDSESDDADSRPLTRPIDDDVEVVEPASLAVQTQTPEPHVVVSGPTTEPV